MSFSLIWESQDQIATAGDETPENIQATADSQVLQMSEDAQAVLDGSDSADKVSQGADNLQQVKQFIDTQVTQGGMSEQTAQLAQIHVESICMAMRMPVRGNVIPSAENFGSSGSKLHSSRLASEEVGDRVKTAWEALKRFFVNLYNKCLDQISKLFNNAMLLDARINSMQKAVSAKEGVPGKEKVDITGAMKLLGLTESTGFKLESESTPVVPSAATPEQVVKGAEAITETIDEAMGKIAIDNIDKQIEKILGMISKNSAETLKSQWTKESMIAAAVGFITGGEKTEKDGVTTIVGPMLPGGRRVVASISMDGDVPKMISSINRAEFKPTATTVDPLTKEQMKKILDKAKESLKTMKDQKIIADKLKKIGAAVGKIIDAAASIGEAVTKDTSENADKDANSTIDKYLSAIKTSVSGVATIATRYAVLLPVMTGETIRGHLAICKASLGSYKKEDKKDDKKEQVKPQVKA